MAIVLNGEIYHILTKALFNFKFDKTLKLS